MAFLAFSSLLLSSFAKLSSFNFAIYDDAVIAPNPINAYKSSIYLYYNALQTYRNFRL